MFLIFCISIFSVELILNSLKNKDLFSCEIVKNFPTLVFKLDIFLRAKTFSYMQTHTAHGLYIYIYIYYIPRGGHFYRYSSLCHRLFISVIAII